ncbi:MAG: peptidoglycan D,D-transpeptidase FtsI family protein [Actinomycetota bacterium]
MHKRLRSSLRLLCLFGAIFAGSGVVAGRLFYLQVLDANHLSSLAAEQRLRTIALPAERGSILAADGTELAISLAMKSVFASPRIVADPRGAAAALAPVLNLDPAELESKLSKDTGFTFLARWIDPVLAEQVEALDIEGISLMSEAKRFYPSGSLASQVVGYVGDEHTGLGGLEQRYDDVLQGKPGQRVMERDPLGRPIASGESRLDEPVKGRDLLLTIDRQIQHEAEAALQRALQNWHAKGGSVIVMDPRTGDILAMANAPTFDANRLTPADAEFRKNRAVTDIYEPGSVSKLVTAAAALETGVTSPGEPMRVADTLKIGAKTFKDSHQHPVQTLSFAEVIQTSSNVGTIKVAERLGKASLHDYLTRFGYGQKSGLNFPGESSGMLSKPENWWATSLGTISIGQGVAVTPLQMAKAYAAVANGGMEAKPRLVKATVDSSGKLHPIPLEAPRRVIQRSTAETLNEILIGVTEGDRGTGKTAAISGYRVAGKTGTAQKPKDGSAGYSGYVASFMGYAPADDPKLVVAVILDDPTPFLAGSTAAVTFKEVMQFSLRRAGATPNLNGVASASPGTAASSP